MAEDPPKRRLDPTSIIAGGAGLLAFRSMEALVKKGLLSQQEAASAFVAAANDLRSGTEDDDQASASAGEVLARNYEKYAAWLLGRKA
jgi:hypothetical protein